jgi:hypothetical protein
MDRLDQLHLDKLPREFQDAIRNKRLTGKKKLRQWLVFLKVLSAFDEQVDERYKKVRRRFIGFGVGAAVAFFISIFITAGANGKPVATIPCGIVVATLLAGFIFYWIRSAGLKKINLDNSFRETLLPLLKVLSEDISAKAKIFLDLNLGDPTAKHCQVSEKKLPPGRNRKLIERVFSFPCIHAAIPLENGTRLLLDIVKQPASYDRYYRSARGKYKHKRKWKMITQVTAGIMPATEEFAVDETAVQQMANRQKVKLKEKAGGQVCRLQVKIKSKSATGVPEEAVSADVVLDMFMKLCTMLSPAGG